MSVKINPLDDRIVAQQLAAQTRTASGLYLPNGQEKPKIAKVVAVGKNVTSLKVGDQIVYKEYSATEVKVEGEEYLIINAEDVLATVN